MVFPYREIQYRACRGYGLSTRKDAGELKTALERDGLRGPEDAYSDEGRNCMRSEVAAAALALLVGCTFSGTQVRKRAAVDFGCPEDEIVVHELPSSSLARGCRKEALRGGV